MAAAILLATATAAGAHTQVQRATPGPGEVVDGTVDRVELDFLDPLLEAPEITVTGPDGAPVAGLGGATLTAPDVAVVGFEALTEPGRYTVAYDYASLDGAPQEGAHQFRFDPGAEGGIGLRPLLAVAVGVVLVVLVVRSVRRR